jgi:hypothetical protein
MWDRGTGQRHCVSAPLTRDGSTDRHALFRHAGGRSVGRSVGPVPAVGRADACFRSMDRTAPHHSPLYSVAGIGGGLDRRIFALSPSMLNAWNACRNVDSSYMTQPKDLPVW